MHLVVLLTIRSKWKASFSPECIQDDLKLVLNSLSGCDDTLGPDANVLHLALQGRRRRKKKLST